MLDGLVRGAVLAEPDRIMGIKRRSREPHHRREADRRAHVVRENEERPVLGNGPAVNCETVKDRAAHGVLADAEMDVPPGEIVSVMLPTP